jgi:hypothetical protein
MENPLIASARQSSQAPRESAVSNPSFFYILIFGILGLCATLWFSFSLKMFLVNFSLSEGLVFSGSIVFCALVFVFQSLFVEDKTAKISLFAVQTLLILGFFFSPFSIWFVLAWGVIFFYSIKGAFHAKSYVEESGKITFYGYASKFTGSFFMGLTLFSALFVVGLYQRAGGITESAYEVLFKGVEKPLSFSLGSLVGASTKMDEVARLIVEKNLSKNSEFMKLPQSQKNVLVREAVSVSVKTIGDQLSTEIIKGETIGAYTYRLLTKAIGHAQALNLGPLIILGLLIFAFLFGRSFLWIIKIPVVLIGQLVYFILRSFGFIGVATESRPKEVFVVK